jgi:hypothetical protein
MAVSGGIEFRPQFIKRKNGGQSTTEFAEIMPGDAILRAGVLPGHRRAAVVGGNSG